MQGTKTCLHIFNIFTNGGILSGYQNLLALHLSGTPSLKTGTSPPSCELLDNSLSITLLLESAVAHKLTQPPWLAGKIRLVVNKIVQQLFHFAEHSREECDPSSRLCPQPYRGRPEAGTMERTFAADQEQEPVCILRHGLPRIRVRYK